MRPDKYKTKKAKKEQKAKKAKRAQYKKSQTKRVKKSKGRNKKSKTKKSVRPKFRNNLKNENNYREAAPRLPHVCDDIEIPKSVNPKRTRIFAIIGHSAFCTFDDLLKIKANREPEGFRLDLKKYKDFPNVRYIPVQDIGKKSSTLRMETFINQIKNNGTIYSGLLQLDDIKSTKNFSKLVECDYFKNYNKDYRFTKKHVTGDSKTLNFNVYPKKDRYGTQKPINATYEFISHDANTPFTGIYEITEEIDDSNNSNSVNANFLQQYINSQYPSNNTNYVENTVANNNNIENIVINNNNNNNNNLSSLDIHSDEILFNPDIRYDFFKQRERELQVFTTRAKIIKTKGNREKSFQDPTRISDYDLRDSKLAALKGSLMMPNSATENALLARQDPAWDMDDLNEFTRLNKKLYQLIESKREFEVSLDEIISLILNDNYMRSNDDFIILDFGCKHIRDLPYTNSVWDRPLNNNSRESTVKLRYPLNKEAGPIWVKESKTYPYVINKLFAEAGN